MVSLTAVEDEQERTVWVTQDPGGRRARYRSTDLGQPHWDRSSGGVLPGLHRYSIHGFVLCDEMLNGELEHSCEPGSGPHRIKVCVMAADNDRAVMKLLKAQAGPKP